MSLQFLTIISYLFSNRNKKQTKKQTKKQNKISNNNNNNKGYSRQDETRNIETTKKPKLNREQRPLGFGPRELQGDEQHYQGTNVGRWWKVVKKPLR